MTLLDRIDILEGEIVCCQFDGDKRREISLQAIVDQLRAELRDQNKKPKGAR